MNYYRTSDGSKISKAQIDRNISQAKREIIEDQKNEYGYNFCQECIKGNMDKETMLKLQGEMRILDCAHVKSVDWCQKNGHSELAWDKSNIRILCRYHHKEWDKTNLKFSSK